MIIVFGSYAKGYERSDSDVDIAYLSDSEVDSYANFLFAQELAAILGVDVDLVDLKKASTVFKAQIIGEGVSILENDKYKCDLFKLRAFKEYAMLNEERKCIFDGIKEEGSIYGQI